MLHVQVSVLGAEFSENTKCRLREIWVPFSQVWVDDLLSIFGSFTAFYFIRHRMKFTSQNVGWGIFLTGTFEFCIKSINVCFTLFTATFSQWMKAAGTPLPFVNISTVVLSKGQHSLSVFVWAVSSMDQGTIVVSLCILDETRTNTPTNRFVSSGNKCMIFANTTTFDRFNWRKFSFVLGNKSRWKW